MIALITTVYNRERYLADAIASVLAQTYTDFKLVIWDDGSTDSSVAIATNARDKDDRIQVVMGVHSGASASASKAIEFAIAMYNPSYIGLVDSDDLLHAQALELMLPVIENSNSLGVVYSDYMAIDELGLELGISCSSTVPYSPERLLVEMMCHHFRLVRTSTYLAAGGIDPDFPYDYDYDHCLKISEIAPMQHFPQVLYYRRMHTDSMTGSHRAEQIKYAEITVLNALERRGMRDSSTYFVDPVTGATKLTFS